jgi:hypothetical protein
VTCDRCQCAIQADLATIRCPGVLKDTLGQADLCGPCARELPDAADRHVGRQAESLAELHIGEPLEDELIRDSPIERDPGRPVRGLVAAELGRSSIMIELNPEYVEQARLRLEAAGIAPIVG